MDVGGGDGAVRVGKVGVLGVGGGILGRGSRNF